MQSSTRARELCDKRGNRRGSYGSYGSCGSCWRPNKDLVSRDVFAFVCFSASVKARLPHKDTSTTAAEEETQKIKKTKKKSAEKKISESKNPKRKGKYTVQQHLGADSCVSEICVISTKGIFFVSVYIALSHLKYEKEHCAAKFG